MDLFDPKPELTKWSGKPLPGGVEILQPNNENLLLPTPFEFRKYGECGMDISEIASAHSAASSTICASSARCTPSTTTTPKALTMLSNGQNLSRPAGGGLLDQLRVGHGEPESSRLCRPARSGRIHHRRESSSGPTDICPRSIRASSSVCSGTPVHHLNPPSHPMPPGAQREILESARDHERTAPAAIIPRESEFEARIQNLRARRPHATWPPLRCSTCPKNRTRQKSSTASTIPSPPAMGLAVSWLAG